MLSRESVFLAAVTSCLLASLAWLMVYQSPSVQPIGQLKSPIPSKPRVSFPTLKKTCFRYHDVTAENECCQMYKFRNLSDILQCIPDPNHRSRNPESVTEDEVPSVNWVFIGDSHTRYIMCAIYGLLNGRDFQCRIKDFKGEWRSLDHLLEKLPSCGYKGGTIEIRHVTLPFKMTFYRDVYLTMLPQLVKKWDVNPSQRPTMVVTNTGMHWMLRLEKKFLQKGIEVAGKIFENSLKSTAPALKKLADETVVLFKMQDDLQTVHHNYSKVKSFTTENLKHFNRIYRRVLSNTGVVLWDSTVPLSIGYSLECLRNPRQWEQTLWWMCKDRTHVGYVLLQQYADMVLNVACNKHLDPQQSLCQA